MTKEWNGQLIVDMEIGHINNTIALLERRAKQAYEHEGEVVRDTLDRFREQKFNESSWTDFLHEAYIPLCNERDRRGPIDTGLNF